MANKIVRVKVPEEAPRRVLRPDIEALKPGQTLRADAASLKSLRVVVSRVTKDTGFVFHTWEKRGELYVNRRA